MVAGTLVTPRQKTDADVPIGEFIVPRCRGWCRLLDEPVRVPSVLWMAESRAWANFETITPRGAIMSFRSVFLAVVIAFALILFAFLINRQRPSVETSQPTADFVRASGKCAECHARLHYSVVHEYEMSAHAKKGVNCLDCHQPAPGQQKVDHHGFTISAHLTAGNCRSCHESIYQEFLRSRHAAPSWAAVHGEKGLTPEQVSFSEQFQPGGTKR